MKENTVKSEVANAITRLITPYINNNGDKINGIYLSPYRIGGIQKIEIVIVTKNDENIPIIKRSISINELRIYVIVNGLIEYKGRMNNPIRFKLAQDLKNSHIIYDPYHFLENRKNYLAKNKDIEPFLNSYELPKELVKTTKSKIYGIKKK